MLREWMSKQRSRLTDPSAKQRVYIPIRFSVLLKSKNWAISRTKDFDSYKDKLFADDRMNAKFFLFSELVLPNLANVFSQAGDVDVKVLIITSAYLPDAMKKTLESLVGDFSYIEIIYTDEKGSVVKLINEAINADLCSSFRDVAYATVRLDDDDMLGHNFLPKVGKYLNRGFCDHIISFSRGYESFADLKAKTLSPHLKMSSPKIALGLTHINYYSSAEKRHLGRIGNIYAAGDHTSVQEKFTLIVDQSKAMYLRMSYHEQDTQAKGIFSRIERRDGSVVETDEVVKHFPELKNLLS